MTEALKPTQEAPATLLGFKREDLNDAIEFLETFHDRTVNVGDATGEGMGDTLLESTTAYAARFIRACLSGVAAPAGASELPPLPEPDGFALLTPNGSKLVPPHEAKGYKSAYPFFTAEQMQEYARAALSGAPAVAVAEPLTPTRENLASLLAALHYGQYNTAEEEKSLRRNIERALRNYDIGTGRFAHGIGSPSAKEDQRG